MKKIIVILLLATIGISSFAGIFGFGKKKSSGKNSKKITLTVGMWGSSPEETALVDKQIAAFEMKYPNIKIKKQVAVGDYNQELQTNFAAGMEPDVFYVDSVDALMYISKKAIVPLNKYLDMEEVKDYQENTLKAFSKDGKIYGLPKDYNPLVMFYNEKMLKEAGAEVPKTWDELLVTLKKIKIAGEKGKLGTNFKFPMSIINNAERYAPFVLQNNGKIYDAKRDDLEFVSKETAEGIDFYYDLVKKGYAETPSALGEGGLGDAFGREKTAIVYSGGWLIPYLKSAAPNLPYKMADLPEGKKKGTMVFIVAYCMGRSTKYPKESVKLIEFLTGIEAQTMTIESGLGLPSRKSLEKDFINKYSERKALIDMTKYATPFQFGVKGRKVSELLTQGGERMYIDAVEGKGNLKAYNVLKDIKENIR